MTISLFRHDLPEWAKANMKMTCTYCGGLIVDNSDTGRTTARWCGNPKCPGHMSYKINELAKFFKVKGVGPKWAEKYIANEKPGFFMDVIPYWFKDKKPYLPLAEIAALACIEGYGIVQARQDLNCYNSFEEYFNTEYEPNKILLEYKKVLIECQKYFEIAPGLSKNIMRVMATGPFKNYKSRDDFFTLVNQGYGHVLQVIQTGKRKTGVSYLIKEKDSAASDKYNIAVERGIPIVTPSEFVHLLDKWFPYKDELEITEPKEEVMQT